LGAFGRILSIFITLSLLYTRAVFSRSFRLSDAVGSVFGTLPLSLESTRLLESLSATATCCGRAHHRRESRSPLYAPDAPVLFTFLRRGIRGGLPLRLRHKERAGSSRTPLPTLTTPTDCRLYLRSDLSVPSLLLGCSSSPKTVSLALSISPLSSSLSPSDCRPLSRPCGVASSVRGGPSSVLLL
jgi:hypothetical protein